MTKKYFKPNIFFGLIFTCLVFAISLYATPKAGSFQQNQQFSFDFPISYSTSDSCACSKVFNWAGTLDINTDNNMPAFKRG